MRGRDGLLVNHEAIKKKPRTDEKLGTQYASLIHMIWPDSHLAISLLYIRTITKLYSSHVLPPNNQHLSPSSSSI